MYFHYDNAKNSPIVHGHLTPYNILFDKNFKVKISDLLFNSLKKLASFNGEYVGVSQYTAPECLKLSGLVVKKPECSCDVYSFGMILWEIMTEKIPFQNFS